MSRKSRLKITYTAEEVKSPFLSHFGAGFIIKIPTKRAVRVSEKSLIREMVMMIQFRPGSHACSLAEMLSVVGEYPAHSVRLLGNERVYKALIHKLTTVQSIRNSQTETEITCRMINISGKGRMGHLEAQGRLLRLCFHLRRGNDCGETEFKFSSDV